MTTSNVTRRKPGRPSKITRQRILAEVDKFPGDTLTMPALAKSLQVETPALYHHFKSREDLVRAYSHQAFAEMLLPAPDAQNWREWFHRINMDLYRFLLENPLLLEVGLLAKGYTPATLHLCEVILETLQTAGFSQQESYWSMLSMTQITYSAARNQREGATAQAASELLHDNAEHQGASMPRIAEFIETLQKQTNEEWLDDMLRWCINGIPEPSTNTAKPVV